jgi:hypothetical protein
MDGSPTAAVIERETGLGPGGARKRFGWRCAIRTSPPRAAWPRRSTPSWALNAAAAQNPSTVALSRPSSFSGDMVALIAEVEQLRVATDMRARVVIDESHRDHRHGREMCACPPSLSRKAA